MKLVAWSNRIVSESCWLERASCRMGTLEALKLSIVGGVTPAGICFNRLRHRGDLGKRRINVHGGLEENLDNPVIGNRLRFDVLDVVHAGGERAFVKGDDAPSHVVGRQARVAEDDADHRNVYVREDVGRRAESGRNPEDHDQHRHDDEGIRTPERESDDAYHNCLRRWRAGLEKMRRQKQLDRSNHYWRAPRDVMVQHTQLNSISGNVVVRPFETWQQRRLTGWPASPSLIRTRSTYGS